jgi:hypothetical protein
MAVKKKSKSWLLYLQTNFESLLKNEAIPFNELTPSMVPDAGGVYLITAKINGREEPYYVGRSKRLRRRIYTNHLMGPITNARLKRYLISSGECKDVEEAKDFIKQYCSVRWIEEENTRKRGAIEGYITGLLYPKHGIYEEH